MPIKVCNKHHTITVTRLVTAFALNAKSHRDCVFNITYVYRRLRLANTLQQATVKKDGPWSFYADNGKAALDIFAKETAIDLLFTEQMMTRLSALLKSFLAENDKRVDL